MKQLLQISYLKESDPTLAIVLLVVIGAFIVFTVIMNVAKNGIAPMGGRASPGAKRKRLPARFSRWALKRAAGKFGLDSAQTALLDRVFRKAQVTDPEGTMANPEALDRHFKHAFRDIEASAETEAESEEDKALLFSVRATLESALNSQTKVISTRKLPDGLAAVLIGGQGENYPVRVISAKGEQLLVEAPKNSVGTPVRFPRGAKVTLSFYSKSSQGYRFETRVQGNETTPKGVALALTHSDRVATLPNRRHKRVETHISCYFSLVQVLQRQQGRKIVKETMVDERRAMGTIVDISAGGCAIKSAAAFRTGEYLKVEFDDPQGRALAAFGRIVRTNKTGTVGGVMHIQFLKAPRKTLNAINATVYGYNEE